MRFALTTAVASALIASAVGQSTLSSFAPVKNDIISLLGNSQSQWPADTFKDGTTSYGPLFVRLAWHCTGSYRTSDGRGGCDGARQRFEPERSWDDNTNLDKARALLQNIKLKYGDALSWGDLIVLAGTTAIEHMGGPSLGFCGGRIDDMDGTASLPLGPTAEQQLIAPCTTNGACTAPLGTTTVGLIYVNPEGPMGNPDPEASAPQIRDTFARMGMNDSETVALIGGGHAFGKTHGACSTGPGPAPKDQPDNPWPGTCSVNSNYATGKGANAYTSGFEGPWTNKPSTWSNEYFTLLKGNNWNVTIGPGGKHQWSSTGSPNTMMLTTDVSLLYDTSYADTVNQYATYESSLNTAFAAAWYKLVNRDMGPVSRCMGDLVAPAQDFQHPLPATPSTLPDWTTVKSLINSALTSSPSQVNSLIRLTFQSCSTFRQTDYLGGCNGARIRFSPQSGWSANSGLNSTISWLKTNVMDKYTGSGTLSYADLIVFAGQTAIEMAASNGGNKLALTFCDGRTDASDGSGTEYLAPRSYDETNVTYNLLQVQDMQTVSGLTARQWVVLQGRPRSAADQMSIGYSGSYNDTSALSNSFFNVLLKNTWAMQMSSSNKVEYKATGATAYVTPQDIALIYNPIYLAIVQEYAANNTLFLEDFAATWTALVNMDRFSGPTGNLCSAKTGFTLNAPTTATSAPSTTGHKTDRVSQDPGIWIFIAVFLVIVLGFIYAKAVDGHFPGCN
jgi:catalase-peroxidase